MPKLKNKTEQKTEILMDKFMGESGDEYTGSLKENTNWATGEEIKNLKRPTQQDLFNEINNRQTDPVSDKEIVIQPHQKALKLIFRNGLNFRDMGNPMYGEENKTNRKNLSRNIMLADSENNKVVVIYGGDLLGEEWELKYLNNARIIETNIDNASYQEVKSIADKVLKENEKPQKNDVGHVKKALFFALGERVKALKRDIRYILNNHPNVDIYLMNGAQEAKINKYFKINVLQTIVNGINDPRVHYIRGVNTIVNVEQKHEDGTSTCAALGFMTNNSLSKARLGATAKNAVKMNSGENLADAVFVTNTNVAGKKGPKDYYVSSESTFIESVAKKFPAVRPRGYNTFSLTIPANEEVTVVEGSFAPKTNPLEMIVYEEYVRNEIAREVLKRRAIAQIDSEFSLPTSTDPVRKIQQSEKYKKVMALRAAKKAEAAKTNENNGGGKDVVSKV